MERRPTEQTEASEQLMVFDPLAAIYKLRSELRAYDAIRPETLEQIQNEELTFVAENLNTPIRSTFVLKKTNDGLVDKRGDLLSETLTRGQTAAWQAAERDNRMAFAFQRAQHDSKIGALLEDMSRGHTEFNTIISFSPFPEETYRQYGPDFIQSVGYQPDRFLGFIWLYRKQPDGSITTTSLSVDNSDNDLFKRLAAAYGTTIPDHVTTDDMPGYVLYDDLSPEQQEQLPNELINTYDAYLSERDGRRYAAGRPYLDEVEAMGFIKSQHDLADWYFYKLVRLAAVWDTDGQLEQKKTELTLSYWAALTERLRRQPDEIPQYAKTDFHKIELEVYVAFAHAQGRHEFMVGCGGMLKLANELSQLSLDEAASSIFGNPTNKRESWTWTTGVCRVEKCPTRPAKTKIGPCHVCQRCQAIFDRGGDPTK